MSRAKTAQSADVLSGRPPVAHLATEILRDEEITVKISSLVAAGHRFIVTATDGTRFAIVSIPDLEMLHAAD